MRQSTRILLAERECLFRRGLRGCFELDSRLQVVATVGTAREAITAAATTHVCLALIGLTLPDGSGFALARELAEVNPEVRTIVIVERATPELLLAAERAGVAALLAKDATECELIRLVRSVIRGERPLHHQRRQVIVTGGFRLGDVADGGTGEPRSCAPALPLSQRELQILDGVSRGLSNGEIGAEVGISVQTVKNHVTSILRKLTVHDRTLAVVLAIQHGWLCVDRPPAEPPMPRLPAPPSPVSARR